MVKKYIYTTINIALHLRKTRRLLVKEDARRVAACELLSGRRRVT